MIPLSFAQQRLWFLHQLEGPGPLYNIPLALHLEGPLVIAALHAALDDVVGRHESLRTVFSNTDGHGEQRVLDPAAAAVPFEVINVDEGQLDACLHEAAHRPFDLSQEMPIHVTLLALGNDQHVLLLLIHHIASDGDSWAPLARDLAQAYAARCEGRAPGWAPLPVQYVDYTLWQHEWLGQESDPDSAIGAEVNYWRDALAGLPEQLDLPVDRTRPVHPSYRGGHVSAELDVRTHRHLLELARGQNASLFMVLHAAVAALLTRLGAGEDIPLGTSVAGRQDDALVDLVGFFVNPLVLRTDTSGNPSFRELVSRTRHVDLGALNHQELPFDRLVDLLNPTRVAGRHPLFQIALVMNNNARPSYELINLRVTAHSLEFSPAKHDLVFSFVENQNDKGQPAGLRISLGYATDLFDEATVARMAQRLSRLLEEVAIEPDRRL
uniref:condensation domain-containing protein n=1 Tax=Luteibacter sp. ME-Dv--P-043b TaxID=3040291 RepID=UPI002554B602